MKKLLFTLSVLFVAMAGFNSYAQEGQPVVGQEDGPVMQIDKEIHDYGTVEYAGDGVCYFTVTNTGNAPLIISKCQGSCGCTVPEWSKEPILPGQSTKIMVKYDTKRPGPFQKTVTITSNAANTPLIKVKIKGSVKAKPVTETTPPTN